MPNWCNNTIEISGSEENMKPIYDFLSKYEDNEHREDPVMNTLVPHDEEYIRIQESGDYLLNPQTTFYGTKWDFSLGEAYVHNCSTTFIELSPSTAWSPPIEFCSKLAKKYGVSVRINYSEPGNDFAGEALIDTEGNVEDNEYPYMEGIYIYGDEEEFWNEIGFRMEMEMEEDEPMSVEDFVKDYPFVSNEDREEIIRVYNESLIER